MKKSDLQFFVSGILLGGLLIFSWILALRTAPIDSYQGEVYRIIYVHVPAAFSAFASALVLAIASIASLRKKDAGIHYARAAVEVGLVFTVLTLATGSIWGKPTWGTWWTWDARLTTTFLLFLLYVAYLLLFHSLEDEKTRAKSCAVLGLLIFIDVPIIYKSVQWWRTLHQTQTILRPGGSAMSTDMLRILITCLVILVVIALWMILFRAKNLLLRARLEESLMGDLR